MNLGSIKIMGYLIIVFISLQIFNCDMQKKIHNTESLKKVAKEKLQYGLENSSKWEKVHAAEYILKLDYPNNVYDIFIEEEKQNRDEPYYRIGLWRVLNQASVTAAEKKQWLDSISGIYENYASPDRVHAAESLAKLSVSPKTISAKVTDSVLLGDHNPMWAYTLWGTAYTSDKEMNQVKDSFINIILESEESILIRKIALYALYTMKNIGVQNWDLLLSKTLNEPKDSQLYASLLDCTLANTPKDSLLSPRVVKCRGNLEELIGSLSGIELATALAVYKDIATEEDLPFLRSFMNMGDDKTNIEIVMAAANAILKINSKG